MEQKKDLMKVPKTVVVAIVSLFVLSFLGLIIVGNLIKEPIEIGYSTGISRVLIEVPQNRGGIFINDALVVNSGCRLLYQIDGFQGWATHGPIIDFDTIPHQYTLGDLAIPYELSKKENCDTIVVYKDDYQLRFLLLKP
jgi:hypothetical protein